MPTGSANAAKHEQRILSLETLVQLALVKPSGGGVDGIFTLVGPGSVGSAVKISGLNAVSLAQANALANAAVGVIVALDGTQATVRSEGEATGYLGLLPGIVYFLDATTPGAITTVAPSAPGQIAQVIGDAKNPTTLFVNVEEPQAAGAITTINVTTPITSTGGAAPTIGILNASDVQPGAVTTSAQTFGGNKTFAAGATLASATSLFQQQGGTLLAPLTEYPLVLQPRDPAYGAFSIEYDGNLFAGTMDVTCSRGYNVNNALATVPTIRDTHETDFFDGVNHSIEMHFSQYSIPAGWNGAPLAYSGRPFSANAFQNGIQNALVGLHSSVAGPGQLQLEDSSDGFLAIHASRFGTHLRAASDSQELYAVQVEQFSHLVSGVAFTNAATAVKTVVGWWDQLGIGPPTGSALFTSAGGTPLFVGRMDAAGDNRQELIAIDAGHNGVEFCSFHDPAAGSIFTDFAGGVGMIGVFKATTNPNQATPPTTGGVLYSDHTNAELKYLDPAGVTSSLSYEAATPLAAATANIAIAGGTWRKLAALGGNIVISVDATGAKKGDQITLTRTDKGAFTLGIVDTASAATLATIPILSQGFALLQFDGANWGLRQIGTCL